MRVRRHEQRRAAGLRNTGKSSLHIHRENIRYLSAGFRRSGIEGVDVNVLVRK